MEELIAFIEAHEPGFSARISGVGAETLAALEARCGRRLPESYRSFLVRMGEDCGPFNVYPGFSYRASELLKFYPEASELGYDPRAFHKIAINLATDLDDPPDFFLDLRRATQDDAPIVGFWDSSGLPEGAHPDAVVPSETGYWFYDNIRLSAMRQYELEPREHKARLAVASALRDDGELEPDQEAWWRDVNGLIDRWQWAEPLAGRSFRAATAAGIVVVAERVDHPEAPIVVRLAANDKKELIRRVEMLHDALHVVLPDGRDETLLAPIE